MIVYLVVNDELQTMGVFSNKEDAERFYQSQPYNGEVQEWPVLEESAPKGGPYR